MNKTETQTPVRFDRYYLTETEEVFSTISNQYIRPEKASVNGYKMCCVRSNEGKPYVMTYAKFKLILADYRPDWQEYEADHINSDTLDDSLSNLQWLTHKKNVARKRNGYKRVVNNVIVEHLEQDWAGNRYDIFPNGKGLSDYYIPYVTINTLRNAKQGKNVSLKHKIAVFSVSDDEVVKYLEMNGKKAYSEIINK